MNLRNTIIWEKEEEKITFSLNGDKWTQVSYSCNWFALASFLLNLIDIWEHIMQDEEFPEQIKDEIYKKWKEGIDNLYTKE